MRWWIIAVLVVVAAVGYLWLRRHAADSDVASGPRRGARDRRSRPPRRRPSGRPGDRRPGSTITQAPVPGEIWWADVPFEDGTGSKVRPCLVLRRRRGGFEVLKITSQDQRHRSDHVEIPTRAWDRDADHNSFLDLTGPIFVAGARFDNRAGTLDAAIWRKVGRLHHR